LLADKATLMLTKNQELQIIKIKFIKLLTSKYNDLKITNKLEDWTELDFKGFSKELEKQKIKLSLSEQSEWIEYFEKEKAKAQEIKSLIEKTDKVIDNMVYKLYELTEDEIKIVEGK
jgi:nicotinamide mononucleotide adenylyltransferase